MGVIPGSGRARNEYWEACATVESIDLPKGEFVARNCKAFKKSMLIGGIVGTLVGLLLICIDAAEGPGLLFLSLGLCIDLLLPTLLSYKCTVNKVSLKEEYYILFFKRKKEILWNDVAYRKITDGPNRSIKLYDINRKRLISFDNVIVGFDRIRSISKRNAIKDIRKIKKQSGRR